MKKAILIISLLGTAVFLATACQSQTVEVTRVVTETLTEQVEVEVTRIIEGESVTETVVQEVTRVVEVAPEKDESGPRTLTLFTTEADPPQLEALNQIIDEYHEMHPDAFIDVATEPVTLGVWSRFATAALHAIKSARLATRVIMVTTYKNTTYLVQALAAGADGFVLKDISREDLLANVRAVAAGESRVDQAFLQSVLRQLNESGQGQQATSPDMDEPLTPREVDVLQLLVAGLTNQAIAQMLGLSAGTVKSYVQTILRKLDVADRTQAAVKAIRAGLVK